MFCRQCGKEMDVSENICKGCGVPRGKGRKHCPCCGNETPEEAVICVKCGASLTGYQAGAAGQPASGTSGAKSKLAGGLLGIFLGGLGIHNFYLGYTGKAIGQLVLAVCGVFTFGISAIAAGIWGFIEGILILAGGITVDGNGNPLGE